MYQFSTQECRYRIALPENYTIKFSCDDFGLQVSPYYWHSTCFYTKLAGLVTLAERLFIGIEMSSFQFFWSPASAFQGRNGSECGHDVLTIVEGSVSSQAAAAVVSETNDTTVIGKFCGVQGPAVSTSTNKMTVVFKSDHLYRYQGFKCRYRAIQPNGIAVINSFGDTAADTDSGRLDTCTYLHRYILTYLHIYIAHIYMVLTYMEVVQCTHTMLVYIPKKLYT